MVTVDRRSEFAAALSYAALSPPAACRSLWIKRAAETCPKKNKKKIKFTNLSLLVDVLFSVSHVTVALEMDLSESEYDFALLRG